MKKITYKCCIFICIAIFLISGWFSYPLLSGMKNAVVGLLKDKNITTFISKVNASADEISYKGTLLDVYSLYYRAMDVRLVEKPDDTIIRLDNDYLIRVQNTLDLHFLEDMADCFTNLKDLSNSIGAEFLYVMAPAKPYFAEAAEATNSVRQEHNTYTYLLKERGVQVLDLAEQMAQQSIAFEEAYFITDHHWLPEIGFWANKQILQSLNREQHFPYDGKICDLSNYDIRVYEDWFLGSCGKKVGRYFTPLGVDDISLITPKFDTEFTVTDDRGTQSGSFVDTLIYMPYISTRDYYGKNPYAAYSGGDFGLQVIQNHKAAEESKKVVIIRDSFADCVTPFLSLAAEEVHSIDVRGWQGSEQAESVPEYIKAVNPDYVIVLSSFVPRENIDCLK